MSRRSARPTRRSGQARLQLLRDPPARTPLLVCISSSLREVGGTFGLGSLGVLAHRVSGHHRPPGVLPAGGSVPVTGVCRLHLSGCGFEPASSSLHTPSTGTSWGGGGGLKHLQLPCPPPPEFAPPPRAPSAAAQAPWGDLVAPRDWARRFLGVLRCDTWWRVHGAGRDPCPAACPLVHSWARSMLLPRSTPKEDGARCQSPAGR